MYTYDFIDDTLVGVEVESKTRITAKNQFVFCSAFVPNTTASKAKVAVAVPAETLFV